jgi:hypothetical protein
MPNENSPEVPSEKFPTFGIGDQPGSGMGDSIFRRSAPSLGGRRRCDGGVRSGVLGDEIGVGAQSIAGVFDPDDDGVVEQPVQHCGGDDGIAEDLAPFGEAAVGGQDHCALLVARIFPPAPTTGC